MVSKRFAAPLTLLVLFVLLAGIPLTGLAWLGWRLMEQDRALERQRARERLENAAGLLIHEVDRELTAWADLLPLVAQNRPVRLPPNAVVLVFDDDGVRQHHGASLPYYPKVSPSLEAPATLFADGEEQEFRQRSLANAAASYRQLASSKSRPVRAGALMRFARVLRKQGERRKAIQVYDELVTMGETPVAGSPAELVARRERIALLRTTGDDAATARETALLASAVSEGRFRIDRSTFEFFTESLVNLPSQRDRVTRDRTGLAEVATALWPIWHQQASGRSAWTSDAGAFATVWRPTSGGAAAIVGRVDDLLPALSTVIENLRVRLTLQDPAGRAAWGAPTTGDLHVTRTFRETDLPWTIQVSDPDRGAAQALGISRRDLFVTGFALVVLVVAAASYVVFRAVNRELRVAQLQSDFVAAVSHEFRTPLTAMCHLTEMLEEDTVPPDRLPQYFRALAKESRRLRAMVENLLDFGRMEAGRRTYQFEEMDANDLVRQIVEEFREGTASVSNRLDLQAPADPALRPVRIRVDRDALSLALRNLLDNAVKYSPESSTVKVSVRSQGDYVGISVEDEGAGIPKREQRDVFRKFARGSAAQTLNVKGTGIGLTMAAQIIKAHGGRLELVSEPGRGSRFTTLLPAQPSHA